ncbi:cyclin-D1-binding protein 1 homolog [Syngnathus typhle]|uniref:cyclin-D1-binding protein 1 homolog n=1 Tax=Syngnathus typhle TaxID=161592 RepID=UPI002A6B615A|nr:cyclin-D1-binding protein 1 homolog [Syngnathus typhle]
MKPPSSLHIALSNADNKAAAVLVLSGQSGIVKDAIEELEQALSEACDPLGDAPDQQEDGEEPRVNQDTYWSLRDCHVVAACQGMMKVTAGCLRKTMAAVRTRRDADAPQRVGQLDRLLDGIKEISPGSSHICGEAELTWLEFLDQPVDHNPQKAKDLLWLDS